MKHILIVDDDKINLDCARAALGSIYRITATVSAVSALEFLKVNTPNLILLDIEMPIMSGYEVMRRLKQDARTARIPVVFLSAEKDAVTEGRCLELGAVDFIPKPFVPSILKSRVDNIFDVIDQKARLAMELHKVRDSSQRDTLTGLFNRTYANEAVDARLRAGKTGALFMIDMDNFKAINDNYGHDAGDRTLQMFADTLRSFTRENDVACRIGGDEFVAFIDGLTDKAALSKRAAAIIEDLCKKIADCKFETNSSVSLGIAIAGEDGEDFTELYNAADKALYFVKMNGKNSYHFYSDEKEVEKERKSVLLDLHSFHEKLLRSDHEKASVYMPGFQVFTNIYQYLSHQKETGLRLLLLNLQTENGEEVGDGESAKAAEALERALKTVLNKSDLATRYSEKQFLLLTKDEGDDAAASLVGAIAVEYATHYIEARLRVYYENLPLSFLNE